MLKVDAEHERKIPLLNSIGSSGLALLNSPPFYITIKINITILLIFINYKSELLELYLNIYY